MATNLTLQGRKDEQVRSYVEPQLKEAVAKFSKERGMTPSQGMRKLIIDGFSVNGTDFKIS